MHWVGRGQAAGFLELEGLAPLGVETSQLLKFHWEDTCSEFILLTWLYLSSRIGKFAGPR
jgi:hypothetical protein